MQESRKDMNKKIRKVSDVWNKMVKIDRQSHGLISWLDSPLVQKYHLKKLKVKGEFISVTSFVVWVKEKYIKSTLDYGLSLGCADGALERHAISSNICSKFDAYDISEKSIKIAKKEAKKENLDSYINYQVANVNKIVLSKNKYNIAFGSMAVHHFLNLEHIFEELRKSLKPKGLSIVNEFVGPSQFQWTEKQIDIMNELLEILPEKYKVDLTSGDLKEQVYRQSIEAMNNYDPSEAIRSNDIVPLIAKYFDIEERIDYGGTILHILLQNIVGNFNPSRDEDITILRLLCYIEERLIKERVLPSDFAIIVARNNKPKLINLRSGIQRLWNYMLSGKCD